MGNNCNCNYNHNSNSDEPCCRCDSRALENDVTNKVTSLEIIVRMVDSKPYYEIKYKKVDEDYYHVGYSSYNLDNVLEWYSECFELVDVKMTNADRIRNMSDEELAEMFDRLDRTCIRDFISHINDDECETRECENCKKEFPILEWLQSPLDVVSETEEISVRS